MNVKADLCNHGDMLTHAKIDNKRRGIVMMLLACLFFSLMDSVMKKLAGHYPPSRSPRCGP